MSDYQGVSQRFNKKFIKDKSGCWLWQACTNADGYGKFLLHGKSSYAHRIAYVIYKNKIPAGLEIDHLCRVRSCVNPDHLEAVTHKINVLRGSSPQVSGVRQREKTHCPSGHPYSGQNLNMVMQPTGRYGRVCRACHNARSKRAYHKKRLEVSYL